MLSDVLFLSVHRLGHGLRISVNSHLLLATWKASSSVGWCSSFIKRSSQSPSLIHFGGLASKGEVSDLTLSVTYLVWEGSVKGEQLELTQVASIHHPTNQSLIHVVPVLPYECESWHHTRIFSAATCILSGQNGQRVLQLHSKNAWITQVHSCQETISCYFMSQYIYRRMIV